ncbi:MAG: S9 family peptidase [Solirubrobacterales bacterium]|nr:S9 family peptidase [Solirubrobacterales bacterium]
MAKRRFRPEDAYRLRAAGEPDLSPDGRRIAFVVTEADEDRDRLSSAIWVAAVDGSSPPRRFSEGPGDKSPAWSPDGRWLAYLSVPDGEPERAHVRLAPLDGGVPARLGDLPGPVSQFAWSPDATRVVVVCRVGVPDRKQASAAERNAPRIVRGLAARLDGVGWQDGRRHLFMIEVEDGSARQLTRGAYDHADPSFSPDGDTIAFASDRHPHRDDRQFRGDAWVMPATGGRMRRLTNGKGRVAFPVFSPDGRAIAFAGHETDEWNEDTHVFVVSADGSAEPERVAPELDRPTVLWPGLPAPFRWTGDRELVMVMADHGSVALHRARVGEGRSRELVGGDIIIDGVAARPGRRTVAYTGSWPDRPSELYLTTTAGAESTPLTRLNGDLLAEVEFAPVGRTTIARPDGTDVEYFTLLPADRAPERLPLHVDIHGGPHASWPSGRWIALHQAIAAAGFAVILPNPRGSTSYGQAFASACTGDWGGRDCDDILACCDDLIERGVVDGGRLFVSGGSYGGFMTSWLVGRTDRFRAATAVAAVVDQRSMVLTSEIAEFDVFNMGGTPWSRPDEYEKRSPLTYLPAVKTPVLVIHWEGDLRVPMSQGDELYTGLRLLGKEAEFVRYPGGFHIQRTPSQAVDMCRRTLDWNRQYDVRRRAPAKKRARSRGAV